jgi:hypothetical protein
MAEEPIGGTPLELVEGLEKGAENVGRSIATE